MRVVAILRALYPTGPGQIVSVDWFGAKLRVHRRIAPALERVRSRIEAAVRRDPALASWLSHPGGGYVERRIAGTDRLSPHSFGIAIDIDPKRTEYWRWENPPRQDALCNRPFLRPVPAALVEAFESEGFIWGGRWYHYDTMHFEFRPELLDPQCLPEAS